MSLKIKSYFRYIRPLLFCTGLFLFSCQKTAKTTLFTTENASQTGITFQNTLPEQSPQGMNIIQYLYYYNGGGVAAGDIDNDGFCDLFFTSNLGKNELYRNKGNFQFENISEKSGIGGIGSWKTGCSMADVNGDGWLDIYVCQVGKYKQFSGKNQLFINNQNGTFTDRAAEYGLDAQAFCTQAAFLDFDKDGDLDCFLLCHSVHSPESYKDTSISRQYDALASDQLLRNDDGKFVNITPKSGLKDGKSGYGLGIALGDVNGDSWTDIYVANDFHENDFLYLNQAGKGFKEVSGQILGHTSNFSMGCDMADFNNDGFQDIISLDMKPEEETILKASAPADGYQIYEFKHSYGYNYQFPRNNLQLNAGGKYFQEIGQYAGVATTDWSWSALLADFDGDGCKDLFITNGIPHRPNDNDYNKFTATAAIQKNDTDLQLIEKMPSGKAKNYAFRNKNDLSFENTSSAWGLDSEGFSNGATYADLDNDGDLDLVSNNINAPAGIFKNNSKIANFLKIKLQGSAKNTQGLGAKVNLWHKNNFQHFENQAIHGFQSSAETGFTIGLGQNTLVDSLEIIWPNGKIQKIKNIASNQTLTFKETDALLVFNEKKGILKPIFTFLEEKKKEEVEKITDLIAFKLLPWSLQTRHSNGVTLSHPVTPASCTRDFDFDKDGDLDRFVGNYANAAQYGIPQSSQLLENDGKGNFKDITQQKAPDLQQLGMVTDAKWADLDKNNQAELIIVGEWMPVYIFKYDGQKFIKTEIPNSRGLWKCLELGDFDEDGDLDLVAGNLGLNTNLKASQSEPLGLFAKDFDNNANIDPILTYYRQGKNYVFADKDQLVGQMPFFKKRFVQYQKYAESTFEDVFTPQMLQGAKSNQVVQTASCFFENKGNGQYEMKELPKECQFSPIFALAVADFDNDGHLDIVSGGNFHAVSPAIGRFDASRGSFLKGDGKGGFSAISSEISGLNLVGEVRGFEVERDKKGQKTLKVDFLNYNSKYKVRN
jgi:enediyne biosynthesis protein E4